MLKIISGSKKCPRTHLDFSAVKAWFPWVCWGGFSFLACLCKRQKKSAVHFPDKTPSSVCYRMNAGWDSTWNHISFSFSSTQIQFTLLLQERISERSWSPEETQFLAKCFPQEGFCSSPQRHCLWSDLTEFSGEPLDRGQDYGSTERGQGHTLEQRAPGGVRLGTHLWDLGPDGCASVRIPCCLLVWSLSLPCTELNDSRATNYYYYPYYCCCYCSVALGIKPWALWMPRSLSISELHSQPLFLWGRPWISGSSVSASWVLGWAYTTRLDKGYILRLPKKASL